MVPIEGWLRPSSTSDSYDYGLVKFAQGDGLGGNLRFDLRFFRNTLFVDKELFIFFRIECGELPLQVGEGGALIPNFLMQLSRVLLQRLPGNDFIRDLERGREFVLKADEFV